MKEALGTVFVALLMVILQIFVAAWGYQVFWNNVVLNVWQSISTGDVVNTMKIGYGACLAIAAGVGLLYRNQSGEKMNISEAFGVVITKMFTKIIMIGFTLLIASIVF